MCVQENRDVKHTKQRLMGREEQTEDFHSLSSLGRMIKQRISKVIEFSIVLNQQHIIDIGHLGDSLYSDSLHICSRCLKNAQRLSTSWGLSSFVSHCDRKKKPLPKELKASFWLPVHRTDHQGGKLKAAETSTIRPRHVHSEESPMDTYMLTSSSLSPSYRGPGSPAGEWSN